MAANTLSSGTCSFASARMTCTTAIVWLSTPFLAPLHTLMIPRACAKRLDIPRFYHRAKTSMIIFGTEPVIIAEHGLLAEEIGVLSHSDPRHDRKRNFENVEELCAGPYRRLSVCQTKTSNSEARYQRKLR